MNSSNLDAGAGIRLRHAVASAVAVAIASFMPFMSSAEAAPVPATFAPPVSYPVSHVPRAVAIADLNRDRVPDLASATYGSKSVSVLLGKGGGTFGTATNYAVGDLFPESLAVADFNVDGRPDLAASASPGVSVLLGRGDGTFGGPTTYSVGALAVAAGDLNRDGKPDLAAVAHIATQGNQVDFVSVLLGKGDGTFNPPSKYRLAVRGPNAVAIGDLNRDGNPDVVTANDSTVSVLLGKGDGSLTDLNKTGTYDTKGAAPRSVAIADLNRDGKPDVAAANSAWDSSTVAVLLGNGDGTLGPATTYGLNGAQIGEQPFSVTVGDFNRDGAPDLATANKSTGNASMLLGNGNGSFGPATTIPLAVGGNPHAIAAGDLDGDGWVDLAAGYNPDFRSSAVGVLLNTKGVLVTPPPTVSVTTPPDGATYTAGSVPAAVFTCSPGAGGTLRPGLDGCSASIDGAPAVGSGTPLADSVGSHFVWFFATDTTGQQTPVLNRYTVNPAPPTVSVTTPPDGATYTAGSVPAAVFTCRPGAGGTLRPGLDGCSASIDGAPAVGSGTPLADSVGSHFVWFFATDTTGQQTPVLNRYTVNAPVNHAPSFTKGPNPTVAEDAGAQSVPNWATNISSGDGAGQTVTFVVTANTNPALFSAGPAVSPTGTLSYTPAPNASGTATVTVVLRDNGGTANGGTDTSAPQSFTITVTPVNDRPSISDIGDQLTNGPTPAIGFTVGDVETPAGDLTLLAASSNPALVPVANVVFGGSGANRTVQVTPAAGQSGVATITVTVGDGELTATDSFVLDVDISTPACTITALRRPGPSGHDELDVTVQDTGSGLEAIVDRKITNGTLIVPNFAPGTVDPVVVTAVKDVQGVPTSFSFHALDRAGNDRYCDPIDLGVVRDQGRPEVVTAEHVPGAAHLLTVQNATPGITNLRVEVNGQQVDNLQLADGETRTVEIGAALRPGEDNVVVLTATGKPGASGVAIIHN